ncbi:MAG: hypothetical protein AAF601_10675 [Pseudomonadota bacterium]
MSEEPLQNRLRDWGLKATYLYMIVLFGGIPVGIISGWVELRVYGLNEIGDFLAGAFGPLAFLWLVLGFLQQGRELQNSVDALRHQTKELKLSVAQQKAMVSIAKEQHDLETDVAKRARRLEENSKLSRFVISPQGGSGGPRGKVNARFKIRNVGCSATRVVLNHDVEGGGEITFFDFAANAAKDFSIEATTWPRNWESGCLTIQSESVQGSKSRQSFNLTDENVSEIK